MEAIDQATSKSQWWSEDSHRILNFTGVQDCTNSTDSAASESPATNALGAAKSTPNELGIPQFDVIEGDEIIHQFADTVPPSGSKVPTRMVSEWDILQKGSPRM